MIIEHVNSRTPGVETLSYLSGDTAPTVTGKQIAMAVVKAAVAGSVLGLLSTVLKIKKDTSVIIGFSTAGAFLAVYTSHLTPETT